MYDSRALRELVEENANKWAVRDKALAAEEDVGQTYASRVIRTAFLAPDLKRAIMIGAQPRGLTLQRIVAGDMPVAWEEQRRLFST